MSKKSNEHIQVFIRCRPLMKSEFHLPVPVEVHPEVNKILVRDTEKSTVKTFSFDKVFGSEAKQAEIYNEIVAPVIQEVILGFNCTIFAYGQTGTGKTFTIEGGRSSNLIDRSEDPLSGIIPRSMKHLFNDLTGQSMKFEICVSFLELYNEEIFDLLSNTYEPAKLKIFENSAQKGSVIVQGLQVMPVTSMEDVYSILDKGCKKRRKANTLLNKASSRSHTIFTVTVNMKESSSTLEKVKCGKLNLVDLAGSENIGRSGAMDKRAREAGNINQSLLALGRVITALCENAGHVPYRESKLTRLLQDSLGGQTKTAVIATISPSGVHIDETLNTLEYALRAKNITNKPELNAQVTVNSLIQDYLEEINRLKKSIYEVGKEKGFLLPEECIKHWESTIATKREENYKMLSQIENLKKEDKSLDKNIEEANKTLDDKKSQLENAKARYEEYRVQLEKEKKDAKLHEAMLQVMQPLYDCLHHKLHIDLEEMQAIESETAKSKEKLKCTIMEQRSVRESLQGIREKRKQWNEKLLHYSENLMNNIRNTHDNVNQMTSECNNYISALKNELEARATDCDKQFVNLFKAVSDFEAINNTFQANVETALHDEKSTKLKWLDEFHDAYSVAYETSILHPLNKAVIECETNLLGISSALNDWKQDLASEMNIRHERLKEHLVNQNSGLESTSVCVTVLLSKQNENLEAYTNIIAEILSCVAADKKLWNEKFINVEQALSSLDIYCTEYIENGVDKTTQAHSYLKNCLRIGSEITGKLNTYCESSVKNIDTMQNEIDFQVQNIFTEKWEGMKMKVDSSCTKYKDLNSELARCSSKTQNLDGRCSDMEDSLKSKFKVNEQPKVSPCIQEMCDSILKCYDIYKSFMTENQIEVDKSLSKDKLHLEKLTESSKQLSNTLNSTLSENIRSLETDLLKNLTTDADTEMHNSRIEEVNHESTLYDLDKTITSAKCSEEIVIQNECPVCPKNTDETLEADEDESLSVLRPIKPQKSNLKPLLAVFESPESRSFMSHFARSPVKRPRSRYALPARKNLQFHDVEKLTHQLLECSSDEE